MEFSELFESEVGLDDFTILGGPEGIELMISILPAGMSKVSRMGFTVSEMSLRTSIFKMFNSRNRNAVSREQKFDLICQNLNLQFRACKNVFSAKNNF